MRRVAFAWCGAVTATVALGCGVSGCATEREPQSSTDPPPERSESTESVPTEASTPVESAPASITVPSCEELIPLEAVAERFSPDWTVVEENSPQLIEVFRGALGPVALQALDQAEQQKHCTWGIPHSDLLIHVNVAELPDDVGEELVAALEDSDYQESETDGVRVFTYVFPGAVVGASDISYGFVDNVWIASFGSGLGDLAVRGMRHANPQLAEEG